MGGTTSQRGGGTSIGGKSEGGGGKAKVSSSLSHGLLQYYFAPFSNAAKKLSVQKLASTFTIEKMHISWTITEDESNITN